MSDQNAVLTQLTATAARLAESAGLSSAADALAGLGRQAENLRKHAQELQSKGYAASGPLGAAITALTGLADKAGTLGGARLNAYRGALNDEAAALSAAVTSAGSADEAAVAAFNTAASALEAQVRHAQSDLDALTAPLNKAFYDFDRHLSLIALAAEAWSEFSGQRGAGESVVIAAEAEWVGGKGRDEAPDGILYLTNGRLIFEQKEKVGKTLGFFGGKKVQEVEWAFDLPAISAVRAKNAGLLGGKDMLYVEHGGQEYTIEVKGRATNDDWAGYIERAKSGAFIAAAPEIALPEASEQAQVLARIERERAERANARLAQKAAADARTAQQRVQQDQTRQALGSMAAAASIFGKKDAAGDDPVKDDDAGAKPGLSGLASALKKASAPEEPAAPVKNDDGAKPGLSGLASAFKKAAVPDEPAAPAKDDDDGAKPGLSGLASAFKKAAAPDEPASPDKGGEKGQQSGGPKGGNVGQG